MKRVEITKEGTRVLDPDTSKFVQEPLRVLDLVGEDSRTLLQAIFMANGEQPINMPAPFPILKKGRVLLVKEARFEAAHHLPNHDGKCKGVHGHSWRVSICVEGETISASETDPKVGMLVDYSILGVITDAVHDLFDHKDLNLFFESPTSEVLAIFIGSMAHAIVRKLQKDGKLRPQVSVKSVSISETCTSECTYVLPVYRPEPFES